MNFTLNEFEESIEQPCLVNQFSVEFINEHCFVRLKICHFSWLEVKMASWGCLKLTDIEMNLFFDHIVYFVSRLENFQIDETNDIVIIFSGSLLDVLASIEYFVVKEAENVDFTEVKYLTKILFHILRLEFFFRANKCKNVKVRDGLGVVGELEQE